MTNMIDEKNYPELKSLENAKDLAAITEFVGCCLENVPSLELKSWGISANIVTNNLNLTLQKWNILNGAQAKFSESTFDSHIENVVKFSNEGVEYVFISNFFDAILPGFEVRCALMDPREIDDVKNSFRLELKSILNLSRGFRKIWFSTFHQRILPTTFTSEGVVERLISEFNLILRNEVQKYPNAKVFCFDKLISKVGLVNTIDERFYFNFHAPYTVCFLDELAKQLVRDAAIGKNSIYKVLALDCDNTLWGGILEENGVEGIVLDPLDYPGNVYWHIQHQIKNLRRKGVLIALCSKNEEKDVNEVLFSHPNCVISDDDVIVKKINWNDKVGNIRQLAEELNVGLDSVVFVDDSEFECESVRKRLPEVKVFKVPSRISNYVDAFAEIAELFLTQERANAFEDKTAQYRIRQAAQNYSNNFVDHDEYLRSLDIKVSLVKNKLETARRVAELSQKTNQFNLTGKRYSVEDLIAFMTSPDSSVYAVNVSDRFGNSGLTAAIIVRFVSAVLVVDSFFVSCRVIGRKIEFAPWIKIFEDAKSMGCREVSAEFVITGKNNLARDFFQNLGLNLVSEDETKRYFRQSISNLSISIPNWFEVQSD